MPSRLPENLISSEFTRWTAGVNFTLPVFDGFKRSGMVWQATANQRAARLEREKFEQQIRLAIQQGFDELNASAETVSAARANVSQAEKVLSMMQNNYKYGAATTLDMVDAETALAVARTNLLRGLHDYSVARANLRWAIGRPMGVKHDAHIVTLRAGLAVVVVLAACGRQQPRTVSASAPVAVTANVITLAAEPFR